MEIQKHVGLAVVLLSLGLIALSIQGAELSKRITALEAKVK